jgi:SAM-dependent methyltransferase
MLPDTAAYYDRLSRWTAVSRAFGYGGGRDALTVHRALSDPRADGRATATRLHDLLAESLPPMGRPRVLDAGCGLGGTMIDLAARHGGTFTGLTVSRKQAAIGRRAIARAGLTQQVRIVVQSYDVPPPGPFDLILAIESLAHSPDPAVSVQGLTRRLARGGIIAIVDDMPEQSMVVGHQSPVDDLATFKAGWRCPVLWGAAEYEAAFAARGLSLVTKRDLTPQVRPRSLGQIARLERLNRVLHRAVPSGAWRSLMDAHHGGLALERLYRRGRMKYRLLIARRDAG